MKFVVIAAAALVAGSVSAANAAVVVNVGDQAISSEQLKNEFNGLTAEQRKIINEDESTRKNIIDRAVNAEILFQAAKKAGLDKDEEYKQALERFQRQYLTSRFIQKAVEPKLVKNELKKFYEGNKTFFDSTEVCAHHIVMQDEKEAEKVTQLAKQKGAKFEELAKKHSLDPTVQENKGNLGCFTRDKMVAEFAAAAFNMKKNEVKGPVKTMYGFHVIKVDGNKPGKVPGYEEIEDKVKDTYRLKVTTELINDLRAKSSVKINDEEVKKFRL